MTWTELHALLMAQAFDKNVRTPRSGAMACALPTPDVVEAGRRPNPEPEPGRSGVADDEDPQSGRYRRPGCRTGEAKGTATLLLVDTARAGAA